MLEKRELWRYSEGEYYARRRIPGMIVTDKGTVIIYNEARLDAGDWAMMDIFCQRSDDGGESFGKYIYLAKGTEKHPTVNNPVMVQDKRGRIHFLYCEDYGVECGRILRRYSDDDGISWSEPADITDCTASNVRNAFAFGPGHGICLSNGRLIIPVWMVPKSFKAPMRSHFPSVMSVFYSDDNGDTWKLGDTLLSNSAIFYPNETECAERADGSVYFNIRHRAHYRASAVSKNGYSDFERYRPEFDLTDAMCFGAVVSYSKPDKPYTVFFANCECAEKRINVVVKGSVDGGESFTTRLVIDSSNGGYVEAAVDPFRDKIYLLYEDKLGDSLHFASFDYEDVE